MPLTISCLVFNIGRSCHKYHFCRVKHVFVATWISPCKLLLTISCLVFIIGGSCHYHWRELPQVPSLSQQTRVCRDKQVVFCRDKSMLAATIFCRDKSMFAAAEYFSRDTHTCLSRQRFCRDKHTFSRQKWYLWQLSPMIGVDWFLRHVSSPWQDKTLPRALEIRPEILARKVTTKVIGLSSRLSQLLWTTNNKM